VSDILQARVENLAQARRALKDEQDNLSGLEAEIEAVFGKRLELAKAQLDTAKVDVQDAEGVVRAEALALYGQDGNKRPHPKVQIKVYRVYRYDEAEALNFARVYMPDALKLNKRAFEKAARGLEGMDLGEVTGQLAEVVTIRDDPRATISKDLGGY
jgi:hypothetical protein